MLTDLRHAVPILLKSPGFSTLIVVVLAVGICASRAIFSIVNSVLWRPLRRDGRRGSTRLSPCGPTDRPKDEGRC
jgi:hypothetical protein